MRTVHAGEVALVKPYAAGLAMTSFSSPKMFSRITSTWSASSPVLSVLLKKLDKRGDRRALAGPASERRAADVGKVEHHDVARARGVQDADLLDDLHRRGGEVGLDVGSA